MPFVRAERAKTLLLSQRGPLSAARSGSRTCQRHAEGLGLTPARTEVFEGWRRDLSPHPLRYFGDCRPGWPQNNATLANIDPRLGIGCRGDGQAFDEILPKAPDPADSGAKLGIKGRPADLDVPLQGMEAVCEPDIDIDDHGTRPNGAKSGLADRDGMFAERPVEVLVQQNPVLPKRRLVARSRWPW